jgi:hypothetical protein
MNYISSTFAVSLFPMATFVKRQIFLSRKLSDQAEKEFLKRLGGYCVRYDIKEFTLIGQGCPVPPYVETGARTIGDRKSMVIFFDGMYSPIIFRVPK